MKKKMISIVSPAFQEAEILPIFIQELFKIIDQNQHHYDWEVILVDDGSNDRTLEVMKELRRSDNRIKWLSLSRNFGHQAALSAGLARAQGDAVIMMDSDLQHPVQLLPRMIKEWETGVDMVVTIRNEETGLGIVKRLTSRTFYLIINLIAKTPIRQAGADFRLISRKVLISFLEFKEVHQFIRGMISWMGFRVKELAFDPDPRVGGTSRYTWRKMIHFALNGLTSFSIAPLRFIAFFGFIVCFFTFLYATYGILVYIISPQRLQVGWTSLLISVNFLGGVILLALGIIGEYVGRIYEQVKNRPIYILKEEEGFNKDQ
jgi:polyisoprenyl-phosphate glycosyltransferase